MQLSESYYAMHKHPRRPPDLVPAGFFMHWTKNVAFTTMRKSVRQCPRNGTLNPISCVQLIEIQPLRRERREEQIMTDINAKYASDDWFFEEDDDDEDDD